MKEMAMTDPYNKANNHRVWKFLMNSNSAAFWYYIFSVDLNKTLLSDRPPTPPPKKKNIIYIFAPGVNNLF